MPDLPSQIPYSSSFGTYVPPVCISRTIAIVYHLPQSIRTQDYLATQRQRVTNRFVEQLRALRVGSSFRTLGFRKELSHADVGTAIPHLPPRGR